jgi:hypothetical protein
VGAKPRVHPLAVPHVLPTGIALKKSVRSPIERLSEAVVAGCTRWERQLSVHG